MHESECKPGCRVILYNMDNPAREGLTGTVQEVKDWGAIGYVDNPPLIGSKPGKTNAFRALFDQMRPLVEESQKPPLTNGKPRPKMIAREAGYTGEICKVCQGMRMVRNGSCSKCEDCGETTGCS